MGCKAALQMQSCRKAKATYMEQPVDLLIRIYKRVTADPSAVLLVADSAVFCRMPE